MSKSKIENQSTDRPIFLAIEDIDFWLSVGCVCPSLETLTEISRNARKIKREKGKVIIRWNPDGSFLVTNSISSKKQKPVTE